MSNRIGGDFNQEAVDAFRAAYAQQLETPDSEEVANNSGLPTNVITNTSPWADQGLLWKYPSGRGPDQDLQTPFDPSQYLSQEVGEEESEEEPVDEVDLEDLVDEILSEVGDSE